MGSVARRIIVAAAVAALPACTIVERTDRNGESEAAEARQVIHAEGVARLPVFSSAVRSGDLVFLSGQVGVLPGIDPPRLVEGGIGPETRQAMENIVAVLDAAGAGLDDVLKCTVFLADIDDYAAMNEVYMEYFPVDPPARSALAAAGLALGARVEIECIASSPDEG